ncbi:hypothetical protein V1227_09695 [Lentzea sp. DG1S-22]|uniref:hypothetical protein n=1 Tax=Lentzea sp. DG1S-22 TaxID=3108822 RepID=UPI002E77C672|nr:hypothetical protein [Lentzea sp. DG1S-22]WVH82998.1 hypothetical protein V1227_09695 [Lentzea sp. DG1S-22]
MISGPISTGIEPTAPHGLRAVRRPDALSDSQFPGGWRPLATDPATTVPALNPPTWRARA